MDEDEDDASSVPDVLQLDVHPALIDEMREAAIRHPDWTGMPILANRLERACLKFFREPALISAGEMWHVHAASVHMLRSAAGIVYEQQYEEEDFVSMREAMLELHRPQPEGSRLQ